MGCQLSAARRGTPAFAGFFAATVTLEDAEVSVGEHYIEPFHTRCVLEATSEDTFFDFDGDVAVESGEITKAALRTAGVCDQIVQMPDDFVDRTGRHSDSYSTAIVYFTKSCAYANDVGPPLPLKAVRRQPRDCVVRTEKERRSLQRSKTYLHSPEARGGKRVTLRNLFIGGGVLLALVVVVFLAALIATFIGRGSQEEIAKQEPTKEEQKPEPTAVGLGQTADLFDRTLRLNGFQRGYTAPNNIPRPAAGNEFISVNVTLTNTGTEALNVSPLEFKAIDSNNVRRNAETALTDLPNAISVGSIPPNEELTGNLILEAPRGDASVKLLYEPIGPPSQTPAVMVELT